MLGDDVKSDLERMVSKDEKILWKRKPEKKCFILEGIFNPLLPFALIWLLIDSAFIGVAIFEAHSLHEDEMSKMLFFFIPFFMLHLMPVWIYLFGALLTVRRYKHTQYIVTDKGIYISGGMFSYTCEMKPYTELSRINIHRGIFDQWLGVGDVVLASQSIQRYLPHNANISHLYNSLIIADIPDYQAVFDLIKKLQTDIYADTMYPNDLRPKENNGYQTEYKGAIEKY